MANGKTIRASFATKHLGFHGIKVFSSLLKLDVTAIEKMVSVLVAIAFCLYSIFCVFWFFYCCALFNVYLFSFALQLQQYCHHLGWPRRLHRNTGAGAIGAYQVPDHENPKLFHVYITFSLDLQTHLKSGIIIPGIGVGRNEFDVAQDVVEDVVDDDSSELSDEEDDDSSELSDEEDDDSSELSDEED
jgi:hypothetical protein